MDATTQNSANRRLPIIEEKIRIFARMNVLCAWIHYCTGILATVLSALIAARPTFLQHHYVFEVVSISLFILVAIITVLAPSRFMAAWGVGARRMEVAYHRYQNEPDYPVTKVFDAYEEAEKMINRTEAMSAQSKEL